MRLPPLPFSLHPIPAQPGSAGPAIKYQLSRQLTLDLCNGPISHPLQSPRMERDEWIQHCDEVSQLLRQIREQGGLPFTPDEESYFKESLDANELGIAFDLLCLKVEETGKPISQQLYDLIVDAGSRMGCPPNDWENLKTLIG
jgi:hypothetical protein